MKQAIKVPGEIINSSPTPSDGMRTLNVKFTAQSGEVYSICTNHTISFLSAEFIKRKKVTVAYNPTDPNDCVIASPFRAYGLSAVLICIGIILLYVFYGHESF
jgi:hypothetical protein